MSDRRQTARAAEGLAAAKIVRRDEAPLLSRSTLLAAITKAVGYHWYPLMSPSKPGLATCFSDVTEEIPKVDLPCSRCGGAGEESTDGGKVIVPCAACHGYGGSASTGEIEIIRTVTWLFVADHEGLPGLGLAGEKLSPGEFWQRLDDRLWTELHPNTPAAVLSRAYHAGDDLMMPSARIACVTATVLDALPKGNTRLREMVTESLRIFRGLAWKLQATVPHAIYGEPLDRHILIRKGRDQAYVPFHYTPEQRNKQLAEYGMA